MSDSKSLFMDTFFDTYRRFPCVYTAGELALASSPLFRKHRLRLYRQQASRIDQLDHQFITERYLIVKDRTPVMRLWLNNKSHFTGRSSPGQPPVYSASAPDMMMGQVDKVLACLEQRLREPGVPDCPACTYIQLPTAVHQAMADLRMIGKREAPICNHTWLPTDYGASLGLTDGYMIQDDGRLIHTFFLPAERRMELYQALTWPRTRWEKSLDAMSLQQRLEKIRQGLPCHNASVVKPVQAFGSIPFSDYMASCPDGAETLRQQFGEMATFQEAADRIFRFCVLCGPTYDCADFIVCLTLPLILIHSGRAPINQATEPSLDILRLPFPSLLMGAATASGQPCLLRSTQLILDDNLEGKTDQLPTICWTLLRTIYARNNEEGIVLLFRLFVEPFALLNQPLHTPRRRKE